MCARAAAAAAPRGGAERPEPLPIDTRIAALEAQAGLLWSALALSLGISLLASRRGSRAMAVGTLRAQRVQIVGPPLGGGGGKGGPWWRRARPGPVVGHLGVSPIDGVPELRLADGRVVLLDLRSGTAATARRELVMDANCAREATAGVAVATPGCGEGGPALMFWSRGSVVGVLNHTNGHAVGAAPVPAVAAPATSAATAAADGR